MGTRITIRSLAKETYDENPERGSFDDWVWDYEAGARTLDLTICGGLAFRGFSPSEASHLKNLVNALFAIVDHDYDTYDEIRERLEAHDCRLCRRALAECMSRLNED